MSLVAADRDIMWTQIRKYSFRTVLGNKQSREKLDDGRFWRETEGKREGEVWEKNLEENQKIQRKNPEYCRKILKTGSGYGMMELVKKI